MRKQIHIFSLLLLLVSSQVWSQQPQLEKVTIASGGHIVHFLPLDVAVAKRFFADEGLDAEITQLKGGTATAQALLAGQVDFSLNSIDHAFKAAVQGKDNLRMVVLLNRLPGMVLVVDSRLRNKVNSIADLKGRALGVTSKGSATHMVLASLLSKSGVSPDKVDIVDAGSATFPPALENHQIAGGIALEPFASILVEQGKAFVLADLNTLKDTEEFLGGPYNQAGVMTRQEVIDRQPGLVRKVVNVHIRALKWIKEHTPEEIAEALPREVVGTDKERYVKTLEKLREFYSLDGIINPQGAENVYRSMVASGAITVQSPLKLETFYTNVFVQETNNKKAGVVPIKSQRPSSNQLVSSKWWNEPPFLIGTAFSVIPLLLWFRDNRQKKRENKQLDDSLKKITRTNEDLLLQVKKTHQDILNESGFSPVEKRAHQSGLDAFEDRIRDLTLQAKRRIKLCLVTPLLHSLRGPWKEYTQERVESDPDHWARKFCEPFLSALRAQRNEGHCPQVDIIYLEDKLLFNVVSTVTKSGVNSSNFHEYKRSIEHFFRLLRTDGREGNYQLCEFTEGAMPDSPMYIALIDPPRADDPSDIEPHGVIAFMNARELVARIRNGETQEQLAQELRSFEFSDPTIVKFFDRIFDSLALTGDRDYEFLHRLLQRYRHDGSDFGVIAEYKEGDRPENCAPTKIILTRKDGL